MLKNFLGLFALLVILLAPAFAQAELAPSETQLKLREIIINNPGNLVFAFKDDPNMPKGDLATIILSDSNASPGDPIANLFSEVVVELKPDTTTPKPFGPNGKDRAISAGKADVANPERVTKDGKLGFELTRDYTQAKKLLTAGNFRDNYEKTVAEILLFQISIFEIDASGAISHLKKAENLAPPEMVPHIIIAEAMEKIFEAVMLDGGEADFQEARRLLDEELPKYLSKAEIKTNPAVKRLNYNLSHFGYPPPL